MVTFKPHGYEKVAGCIFSMVPSPLLKAYAKGLALIGYYHLVSDEVVEHVTHLYEYKNRKRFENDLDYFLERWNPISFFDLMSFAKAGQKVRDGSFLLTFDDGLREAHDVIAPILLKKGIPAIFFLSSAFLDNKELAYDHKKSLIAERLRKDPRNLEKKVQEVTGKEIGRNPSLKKYVSGLGYRDAYMLDQIAEAMGLDFRAYLDSRRPYLTTDDARRLVNQGFALGAHGIDHPPYSMLPFEEQVHQTVTSMRFIRDRFGLDYGAFAFPHGDGKITKEFFGEIEKEGLIDISFGGSGIIEDSIKSHFQRFSLEDPLVAADKLVAFQLARRAYRRVRGIKRIER